MNQTLESPLRMLSLVVVHCAQRDTVIVETSGKEGNPTLAQERGKLRISHLCTSFTKFGGRISTKYIYSIPTTLLCNHGKYVYLSY